MDGAALLAQLVHAGAVAPSFGRESRYYGLPVTTLTTAAGEEVRFVARRFIPPPERFAVLARQRIQQGDRIDVIAAAAFGDPLLYWRICDANLALDPAQVTATPGEFVRIPLPAGPAGS